MSAAPGAPRVHLRVTDSTNERARELAMAGAPSGTLVTASEQTAGRGRQGRRWSAPRGSALLMSIVLRDAPLLLPLMSALAVCDVAGDTALIKWPNDVVLVREDTPAGLAKVAGILAEGRPREGWIVLGIGLNVAVSLEELPPELRAGEPGRLPAASLERPRGDVEVVLARLLDSLGRRLGASAEQTLEAWRSRDALREREISWSAAPGGAAGHGVAQGIDGEGRLVVALADGGRTALGAGEVHLGPLGPRSAPG
jgi:BirA family biotin operon repressor/biotin-[acetyl-CoA-carboxylase] ligase